MAPDPDPALFRQWLFFKMPTKVSIFFPELFCLLHFEGTFSSVSKDN
jgi:hypothetical protein